MAKFNVGDLVDVRLCAEFFVTCNIVGEEPSSRVRVSRVGEPARVGVVHVDDCIPHVPAPVVPPAPVDPLTGLTAAEIERRYSARLAAFGRGEADPFAVPKYVIGCDFNVDDQGEPDPYAVTPARVEPRALTIEDVKDGSRWVSFSEFCAVTFRTRTGTR